MNATAAANGMTQPVYAGRAALLVPTAVDLRITSSQVNEVTLHAEPGATDFQQKWEARVAALRAGTGVRQMQSKVDREWPGDHTVQYDISRGTLPARTWERWGVVGDTIVQGTTATALAQADAARQALGEVFSALIPDGKPAPGDFRFQGGIARLPLNGAEQVRAEWQEPFYDAPGQVRGEMKFTLSTEAMSEGGSMEYVQQDMRRRLAETEERGRQDGAHGVEVKQIRTGVRLVNGIQGQESVVLYRDKPTGKVALGAEWIAPGASNDAYQPATDMAMAMDDVQPADVDKAVAQWTAALQTLRFPRK